VSLLFDPIPSEPSPSLERYNPGQLLGGSRVTQARHVAEQSDNDRHVLRCWHEWEFDGSERRIVLCVQTDLELRPGCDGFDAIQLDQLVEVATDMMRASASPISSMRIVPQRQY
jgi:hypothetical protein